MRRGERTYEVKTNGIPQLKEMPKDLLNLLCTALLDAVLEKKRCLRYGEGKLRNQYYV